MKKLGFIGAGNMGGAIIRAACRSMPPADVIIYDLDSEKTALLADATGCMAAQSYAEVIDNADIVMFCVKPQFMDAVLDDVLPMFKNVYDRGRRQIAASIVAAYEIKKLAGRFRAAEMELPIIRMMPNTPVTVGKGVILFAGNEAATDEDIKTLMDMLKEGGLCKKTTEKNLDTACPVFSCSPAFVYMFIEALADGGVQIGLFRDDALELAAQAVLGAAAMVLETGKHPGRLKDEVCSPGGITIAGVSELEKNGFRNAAMQAVLKAYERQEEMSD